MTRIKIAAQLLSGLMANKGIAFINEYKEQTIRQVFEITDELIKQNEEYEDKLRQDAIKQMMNLCKSCTGYESCKDFELLHSNCSTYNAIKEEKNIMSLGVNIKSDTKPELL